MKRLINDQISYKMKNMNDPSYQSCLTKDEIRNKLDDYERVNNIFSVNKDTHIRYFIKEGDDYKFRMGGLLYYKCENDGYVVLNNGRHTWTVQVKDTQFFKLLNKTEIKEKLKNQFQKELEKKDKKIRDLNNTIKDLKKKNDSYRNKYKHTKNEN